MTLSNDSPVIDTLLAALAAQYVQPTSEVSKERATAAVVQAVAKRPMRKLRDAADPSPNGGQTQGMPRLFIPVPAVGYYDAKGFIVALRKAKSRDEQIAVIAGYRGYDPKLDFGSNEYRAKSQALRELRPEPKAPASGVIATVKGYVAGMPNDHAKRVKDLLARERLAADAIVEHEALAKDAQSETERDYQTALVLLERERLANIREQLKAEG
jgi:hypothetical protein